MKSMKTFSCLEIAAIDGGEAGAAFLGSQGDEWDAQKDMLCDMSGTVCSVSSFLSFNSNEDARRSCNV